MNSEYRIENTAPQRGTGKQVANRWLRLIAASDLLRSRFLAALTAEAEEITRVLTAIVKNARREKST